MTTNEKFEAVENSLKMHGFYKNVKFYRVDDLEIKEITFDEVVGICFESIAKKGFPEIEIRDIYDEDIYDIFMNENVRYMEVN